MDLVEIMESSVDPDEDENNLNATFWQQLKATVIRNLLRKKRNKKQVARVRKECILTILPVIKTKKHFTLRTGDKEIMVGVYSK